MADLLESIVVEIETRQAKLKPVIAEYERLQAAAAALGPQPNTMSRSCTAMALRLAA